MGTVKQINTKIRTYYFYNHISDLQNMMQGCYELTKNHTKTLVFRTLDILQLKKLMIVQIFTV